jgi:hypothetical protein
MMRLIGYLFICAVVLAGLWPYYSILQIDQALRSSQPALQIEPYVDLVTLQSQYQQRFGNTLDHITPSGTEADPVINWLTTTVRNLGAATVSQVVTTEWLINVLNSAIVNVSGQTNTRLFEVIDFAFFESWDRFVVRIGALDQQPTYLILKPMGQYWKIVDILH